jgi:hypothetical protein
LSFCFETEDIRGSFDTFDLLVKRYESAAADLLPDKLKVGMVSRGLKEPDLRQHLLMQSGRLTTYALVREEIRSITIARRAMMPSTDHAPMDISWVDAKGKGKTKKGKGDGKKGDGKVKGKDKNSGKSGGKSKDRSEVTCHYCSKKGHIRAECRKRVSDEAKGVKVHQVGDVPVPAEVKQVTAEEKS